MNLNVTIDARALNLGLSMAAQYSKRTPSELVNTCALEVAIGAKYRTPFVTPEKVDTELSVVSSPAIGKRGKPLKRKKVYKGTINPEINPDVAFAVLIVQARSRPGSRYNELTHGRYALPASPFKGVSREAGRAAMAALVDSMIKSRHSSGKFLLAGWIPAIQKLLPYSVNKYRRGSGSATDGQRNYYGTDLGDADPASPGEIEATALIQNDVGGEGINSQSHNRALQTYGAPALQAAMTEEGAKQMNYYLKKSSEDELFKPVNRVWK